MIMTPTEMFIAKDFAQKIVNNIDQKDFLDGRNAWRSPEKVMEDNIKGKLAEIYLMNELGYNNINTTIDINIYDLGICDDFDIVANNKSIDVKASSMRARNLLVEVAKLKGWASKNKKPDYLCMITVAGNEVKYLFGTTLSNFCKKGIHVKRGEFIPGTRTPLKADNIILNIKDASTNVQDLIDFMS